MTSLDIDFHINFSEPSSALPHRRCHWFKWKRRRHRQECMWLRMCIPIHWYVCNSGYLTYLQIVHLLKREVYHLWAPWLVRLRSQLDATGLLLWKRQLPYWIARILARWQKPLAGRPMAIRLDGCTFWRLSSDTQLDTSGLDWAEPSLELTKKCIWCINNVYLV